jgi:branched-chain amino acid transport system ATP-binding protein
MSTGRLEGRQLVHKYDGVVALDHVDIVAEPGRITAVIGPNGAGKTTLFDVLSGVQIPDAGVVILDGRDVTALTTDARARLGLARTFQHGSVFPTLTVEENLKVGAENRSRTGTLRGFLGLPDPAAAAEQEIVEHTLADLGLESIRRVPAGHLPTGTLRLVELGRALCARPVALLLDEPVSGLGDAETVELRIVLERLAAAGMAMLLVEHDLAFVREIADIVYVMATGRVIASGSPDDVVELARVRAAVPGAQA